MIALRVISHDLRASLFVALMFLLQLPAWAAFSVPPPGLCMPSYVGYCYQLTGEINMADARKVEAVVAGHLAKHIKSIQVILNSSGGDVQAAMRIGRALRKINGYGFVREDCLSACVFVLAGTTHRAVVGRVGIHRPYLVKPPTSFEDFQRDHTRLEHEAQSYLTEMNFPARLYESMAQVPSHRIKILTQEELDSFGLDRQDPVSQDFADSRAAESRGITKQEYLRRVAEADIICGDKKSFATAEEGFRQIRCRESMLGPGR